MIFIIFFISGLIIGSFLNVVVYRLHVAESITHGRSKCPHCRAQIKWYDNIPLLSFILLRFRCRYCREKISWQYPLVEFFTGILFAIIGYKYFSATDFATWSTAIYYLVIVSFLVAIFVYDALYMEIPEIVLWPAVGWAVAFNLFFDWSRTSLGSNVFNLATFSGTLAALAAFLFFFLMVAVSREKWMGMGDAYLAILLGLILGWPNILLALLLAFGIGAIYGVILILAKRKNMKSQIPFAPFLILGTAISMFFYSAITNWYWGLFM
jgi:leader peptidase (prepilin peptidase) / N-methyltransferase